MGRISKMGDRYLRRLLVIGMTSQLQAARIAWVIMTREEIYCAPQTRNGANPMTN
jgi:homoserine acetyltransferase